MNAPLPVRRPCSRPGCWNRATTRDLAGRLVCRPDCHGGSGLGDLPPVRLEDLPHVAGPVHHKRPLSGRYAMTSRVLLALADGLRGETLRETTRATPKELRTVVSNLRKQGMVGEGYSLTTIGQGRVEQLRALLAEGGSP